MYELPLVSDDKPSNVAGTTNVALDGMNEQPDERSSLLQSPEDRNHRGPPKRAAFSSSDTEVDGDENKSTDDLGILLAGNNALEIAAIGNAKKFVSQRPVQKIVSDIWDGEIIFWESLSINAVKKARPYNKRVADPYTRLRVPRYQKCFQIIFFIIFLILYYTVLVERNPRHVTVAELFLYIWIFAFAYDEYGELFDAGYLFYKMDFWSLWDIGIIGVGVAFLFCSKSN